MDECRAEDHTLLYHQLGTELDVVNQQQSVGRRLGRARRQANASLIDATTHQSLSARQKS